MTQRAQLANFNRGIIARVPEISFAITSLNEFRAHLSDPARHRRSDPVELRTAEVAARVQELRVVEHVEKFRANQKRFALAHTLLFCTPKSV
jgi:hypothetical protein